MDNINSTDSLETLVTSDQQRERLHELINNFPEDGLFAAHMILSAIQAGIIRTYSEKQTQDGK